MTEYLTFAQLKNLLEIAKAPRDLLIVRVLYETGCTVSELTALRKKDVKSNEVQFGDRSSRISAQLIEELNTFGSTHTSEFVFASRQSPSMTPKRIQQIIAGYLRTLNLGKMKRTPQLLRYTHIAHAVLRNVPFPAIMKQTGLKEQRLSQIVKEVRTIEQDPYGRMFS